MGNSIKTLFAPFFIEKFQKKFLTDSQTLIVIDTNYLLSILRLSPDLAIKYITALTNNKENIYVPYIVALEFNFNKSDVKYDNKKSIAAIDETINDIKTMLSESQNKLSKILLTDQLNKIKIHSNEYVQKLNKDLIRIKETDRQKKDHETYNSLIEAISTKIGEKPTQSLIDSIEKEGITRYENKIAPGYEDEKNKKGSRHFDEITYQRKYGDLLIWKDIIEKAKELRKKRVVFVTDDGTSGKKSDLFYKINGNTIGPKIEMMDELYKESHADLYILRNEYFVSETVELDEQQKQEIRNLLNANEELIELSKRNKDTKLIQEINFSEKEIEALKTEISQLELQSMIIMNHNTESNETKEETIKEIKSRISKLKIKQNEQMKYNTFLKNIIYSRRNDINHGNEYINNKESIDTQDNEINF